MSHRTEIAIIGAGPIGLEAALAASEAGRGFVVLERADTPAGNVRTWGHVRLFTPWPMNVSPRARRRLTAAGLWPPSGEGCPTGAEFADQALDPIARFPDIAPHLRLNHSVRAISRDVLLKHDEIGGAERASRPFRLLVDGPDGEHVLLADVVLDCSGTFHNPQALGAGGIPAPGEGRFADRIGRVIPNLPADEADWADRRILLVGAGHSAQTAAVDLADIIRRRPGTNLVWAIRRPTVDFSSDPHDPLPERASLLDAAKRIASDPSQVELRTGVVVDAVTEASDGGLEVRLAPVSGSGKSSSVVVDRVLALTGAVGDHALYRQLQVHECWATEGPMKLAASLLASGSTDCLDQVSPGPDVLTNPEPNFFILGAKSYGRNTTFLFRVGWEQVSDVFSLLASEPANPIS